METPLQFILQEKLYEDFHKIATQLTEERFQEFIDNKEYISKIIEMFIYILELVGPYPKYKIDKLYCELSYEDDIDIIDEDICKIKKFLIKVSQRIKDDVRISDRKEFKVYD